MPALPKKRFQDFGRELDPSAFGPVPQAESEKRNRPIPSKTAKASGGPFFRLWLFFLVFALAFALAGSGGEASAKIDDETAPLPKKEIVVYTALTATTAQLPLLGALAAGWPADGTVKIEFWKNMEDLRALVLAGQGDVWIGHLETLARAASRGAPVRLAAATVWRKFYFVSRPLAAAPDGTATYPASVEELLALTAAKGETIATAPQNSPSEEMLKKILGPSYPLRPEALPPQQLVLEMIRGQKKAALLPEPLASSLVRRDPELKIIGSLEEEYARRFGGPSLIPQAGVAVHEKLASERPDLVKSLLALMTRSVDELQGDPQKMLLLLPAEARAAIGDEALLDSLTVEPLIIKSASDAKSEIDYYLSLAAPDLVAPAEGAGERRLPETFIWSAE
ncbi:MAG: hypothetical protein LBJ64_10085 [Deltaproteobacteria bacterium]|jgi:NitT/TauT family transport system substrate-binding protein|nr:hypothetical protein [Deltaproteobacteria bacterium]